MTLDQIIPVIFVVSVVLSVVGFFLAVDRAFKKEERERRQHLERVLKRFASHVRSRMAEWEKPEG